MIVNGKLLLKSAEYPEHLRYEGEGSPGGFFRYLKAVSGAELAALLLIKYLWPEIRGSPLPNLRGGVANKNP